MIYFDSPSLVLHATPNRDDAPRVHRRNIMWNFSRWGDIVRRSLFPRLLIKLSKNITSANTGQHSFNYRVRGSNKSPFAPQASAEAYSVVQAKRIHSSTSWCYGMRNGTTSRRARPICTLRPRIGQVTGSGDIRNYPGNDICCARVKRGCSGHRESADWGRGFWQRRRQWRLGHQGPISLLRNGRRCLKACLASL